MQKEDLIIIRDFVIGWVLALACWSIVRNWGVTADVPATPEWQDNVRMVLIFGPLGGLLFGLGQIKFEKYLLRRVPMWKLLIIGLLLNTLIMASLFVLAFYFFENVVGFDEPTTFRKFVSNPSAILTFLYSILVNFFLASLREINLLLGKGNLWRFLRGDFYSPRVENRIFMFIDLKSSTTIAEQLGHIKYSRFLQDCFYDLNAVRRYDAEVYQYVGDEVILSWRVKKSLDLTKCIKAFWAFEDQLRSRHNHYMEKYGVVPTFKAGINLGEVTTAEVGEIKKEIAYHGDTMNIAARIQDKCNDFGQTLLISEHFHAELKMNGIFEVQLMGEELLRGKNESLKIYAVIRNH